MAELVLIITGLLMAIIIFGLVLAVYYDCNLVLLLCRDPNSPLLALVL